MRAPLVAGFAALALLAAAPVGATMPSGNLVVNPGAEAAAGAADSSTQVPIPAWSVESTFTAVQYGAPGGFLTAADSAALGGGANFFAGGPGGAVSAATQVIDVSGAGAEIDAGKVAATLSAQLGGYATQTDHAAVTATFLTPEGNLAGSVTLPPVSVTDRNSVTGLVARSSSGAVPPGTRQVSIRIQATRDSGSYNDGYVDNVSLALGAAPVPVFHKTVVVKLISGRVGIRRPGSKKDVDLQGSDDIPLGSIVDTGAGVVELTSVAKAGGTPQAARFYEGVFKVTQAGSLTVLA